MTKDKMPKHNKAENILKNTWSLFYIGQLLLSIGPAMEYG